MTVKSIKLPNGTAIVASSGHSPYTAVFYVNSQGQFMLAFDDENRRCVDEREMLTFAAENAPMMGIVQPGPKPKPGKERAKGELN